MPNTADRPARLTINRTSFLEYRAVLLALRPFVTSGSLRGDRGTTGTGRLPADWARTYTARRALIDYTVTSYATPIAWHDTEAGWVAPAVSYSVTTSKSQGRILPALAEVGYQS